jgi:hypothetical protein
VPDVAVSPEELARLKGHLLAAASLPLEQLAAMPCIKGPQHRWRGKAGKPKKCKACGLVDFRSLREAGLPFDPAEHRTAVRHAILTGQVLG